MINYKQLVIVDNTIVIQAPKYTKDKRYVIGVDPAETVKDDFNIFKVYDRMNCSYCAIIKTRRKFDDIVQDMLKYYKLSETIISRKFVDLEGNPIKYAVK